MPVASQLRSFSTISVRSGRKGSFQPSPLHPDNGHGSERLGCPLSAMQRNKTAPNATSSSISGAPTRLPRDSKGAELASGTGRNARAGIKFYRVFAVHQQRKG